MSKAWYVINSYSGYENKAKEQLMDRIVTEGQEDFFGRIEVPTQEITEIKGGKEKVVQKKFFPGYILVEMEMNDDTWHLVKETPRVLGFIGGTKNNPKSISDTEESQNHDQCHHSDPGHIISPDSLVGLWRYFRPTSSDSLIRQLLTN